ncbi:hypothetical protein [Actinacidiphila acidipaludis]|uniref:Galactose mutarotase n=1 Tax=Actinacidiphila acidipaludis TaxID=2873382 RepID=A0ABS7Q863_9ACTN|nr:hypothetical protein [Streptomyces acidipaludis]MBY8879338.1 hypothetical protein [Streptomyces acidipaludis]
MVSTSVPVSVGTDPRHGGRWTSLRAGGREWLWHRAEPRRAGAVPGDPFADAGGLEECVPTVRGLPDHGDAWSRAWAPGGPEAPAGPVTHTVECPGFRLTRTLTGRAADGAVIADYRLSAAPGYRFVWAAHALLEVSPQGRVALPGGSAGRLYPDGGAAWTPFAWPRAGDTALDRLGPDDGTALGAVVDAGQATVHDGPDRLRFTLEAEGQPVSVALWRNLRGFPEEAPYRSIGVEPMLGRVFDLAAAGEGDAAHVPASGEAVWRLTVTAATTP